MIFLYIVAFIATVGVGYWSGQKVIKYLHAEYIHRALNGQFDVYRIIDSEGTDFQVQYSHEKWIPEWRKLPFRSNFYNIDDAKKELAKFVKDRQKELADDKARRDSRFQDIKQRKQIIKENKKLLSGVSLSEVKQIIPEEWV